MASVKQSVKWRALLQRIKEGRCTPFLGSELYSETVPSASELAREMAVAYEYPNLDGNDVPDLARVAQYVATMNGSDEPKHFVARHLREAQSPDFHAPGEPHALLAQMPLPIYITTAYHEFMAEALRTVSMGMRDPRIERCHWGPCDLDEELGPGPSQDHDPAGPTPARPSVFHLFGSKAEPRTLVLSEDDYLDFLARTSENQELIPERVRRSFASASLLFLGYQLTDMEFGVLLRTIGHQLRLNTTRHMMALQLVTMDEGAESGGEEAITEYLGQYCGNFKIDVYWGSAREFLVELGQRWESFMNVGSPSHD